MRSFLLAMLAMLGGPAAHAAPTAPVKPAPAVATDAKAAIVLAALKTRLPKTTITRIDCRKMTGLCEVTAGTTLFYVDSGARFMVIGRVFDMQTRQDLTTARLLELNPTMMLGGAAKADDGDVVKADYSVGHQPSAPKSVVAQKVALTELPKAGVINWGKGGATAPSVTIFTDFHCGYCRALVATLDQLDVRVAERPISVLGSRAIANAVYCARAQDKARRAAYAGEPVAPAECDTKGLDANEAFARAHGFAGTPILVRADGAVLEGYRAKEVLEAWIKGGNAS